MATQNDTNEATLANIERFINKIAQKFPPTDEPSVMTDIHLTISQDSGELMAFNDNDNEITRCVIDQWINCQDEDFYNCAASVLRGQLQKQHAAIDKIGLLKPFSFILETDEHEHFSELYLVDSDIKIIGGDLMDGLEDDLNTFFEKLIKE